MTNRSPESREATSESLLASALVTVLTSKIIDHTVLSEALLAGKSLHIIDQLKQYPQDVRDLLAQNLLRNAMPAIQVTQDGQTIDEVPENLFLLACALGVVPEVDREAYIAKHMKLNLMGSPEDLAQELVKMHVITQAEVPALTARYQIDQKGILE
jgi:hypothetical protein